MHLDIYLLSLLDAITGPFVSARTLTKPGRVLTGGAGYDFAKAGNAGVRFIAAQ